MEMQPTVIQMKGKNRKAVTKVDNDVDCGKSNYGAGVDGGE